MRCEYDEETLKLVALAIGTCVRNAGGDESNIPDHHLRYLALKLVGKDSLGLDGGNEKLFGRIKEIVKEMEG